MFSIEPWWKPPTYNRKVSRNAPRKASTERFPKKVPGLPRSGILGKKWATTNWTRWINNWANNNWITVNSKYLKGICRSQILFTSIWHLPKFPNFRISETLIFSEIIFLANDFLELFWIIWCFQRWIMLVLGVMDTSSKSENHDNEGFRLPP